MQKLVAIGVVAVLCWASAAYADDTCCDEGVKFSLGMSTSYVYDFNDPSVSDADQNALSYANLENKDNAFNIDLVQVGVSGTRGKASYGAKVDYGDLAVFAGDDLDGDIGLQEAYLSYDFGPLVATAGRFPTPIGYEVLEPWGNAQISRSRAWTQFVPISHDGLNLSGSIGNLSGSLGVINQTFVNDPVANDNNDEKGVVGSMAWSHGDVAMSVAALYSPEDLGGGINDDQTIVNVIVSAPVDQAHFAIEGNWAQDDVDGAGNFDFWNVVLYGGIDLGPIGFDVRGDYGRTDLNPDPTFAVDDNTNVDVWSITTTFSVAITDELHFSVEYRHDDFGTNFFADDDGEFSTDTQNVIQAQLVMAPDF